MDRQVAEFCSSAIRATSTSGPRPPSPALPQTGGVRISSSIPGRTKCLPPEETKKPKFKQINPQSPRLPIPIPSQ
ncbi:hypothetical protein LZ554_009060 [Drepanopeziza brunnea f. sp. 'monogermtubi']|nr:hypothetical protein LZ554_009060 [Drepanopeziza brunnea f. sp. 'monogermtubi']